MTTKPTICSWCKQPIAPELPMVWHPEGHVHHTDPCEALYWVEEARRLLAELATVKAERDGLKGKRDDESEISKDW